MKVVDLSPIRANSNALAQAKNFLIGSFRFGSAWFDDVEAQKIVIEQLDRVLDRRFIVLQNLPLEGLEIPVPLLLIGPTGLSVIYVHAGKGIFRAKQDAWTELNRHSGKFEDSENLITCTLEMQKVVDSYLTRQHYAHPPIQAILLFTDPGTHVDSIRPAVRVLMRDALERLGISILQDPVSLNYQDVHRLVGAFDKPTPVPKTEPRPVPSVSPQNKPRTAVKNAKTAQTILPAAPTGFERLDKYAKPKKPAGGNKPASVQKPNLSAVKSVFIDDGELNELLGISDWGAKTIEEPPQSQNPLQMFKTETPQSDIPPELPQPIASTPLPRLSIFSRMGSTFKRTSDTVAGWIHLTTWQLVALAILGIMILCFALGVVMIFLLYS